MLINYQGQYYSCTGTAVTGDDVHKVGNANIQWGFLMGHLIVGFVMGAVFMLLTIKIGNNTNV